MDVPLSPMAMNSVVPMVVPIVIGANGCVTLAPMAIAIGSIIMDSMDPLDGNTLFTITIQSE